MPVGGGAGQDPAIESWLGEPEGGSAGRLSLSLLKTGEEDSLAVEESKQLEESKRPEIAEKPKNGEAYFVV